MKFLQTTWLVINGAWECVLDLNEVHWHCKIMRIITRVALVWQAHQLCTSFSLLNPNIPRWRRTGSCSLQLLKRGSNDSVTEWLSGSKIVSQNPITAFHKLCPFCVCPQPSKFFNLKIKAEQNRLITTRLQFHQWLKIWINFKNLERDN